MTGVGGTGAPEWALEAALEQLPLAVLVPDQTGRIVFSNPAARGVLARADCVRVNAGRFEVADRHAARRLRQVLASARPGEPVRSPAGWSLIARPP